MKVIWELVKLMWLLIALYIVLMFLKSSMGWTAEVVQVFPKDIVTFDDGCIVAKMPNELYKNPDAKALDAEEKIYRVVNPKQCPDKDLILNLNCFDQYIYPATVRPEECR